MIANLEINLTSGHFHYFMNQMANIVPTCYLDHLYNIKKCNEISSNQFGINLIEFRNAVEAWTKELDVKGKKKKVPKMFVNRMDKYFKRVEMRIKVIGQPKDLMIEMYNKLVID